ncbi:conjugal transfer protein TraB (plasmid) [Streptomyces uncialis]|uniref:conjugal transfer protein TraB n=1 Tax=Streptomyces uncialis TaxID=1048205 RepID=UPI002E30F155|nr:conjugal transfer protein TraB [Streptomyces uncialis]
MTDLGRASEASSTYEGLQRALRTCAKALDAAAEDLAEVTRRMKAHAGDAEALAQGLEDAGGDARYVEMTSAVAAALGGAARQCLRVQDTARSAATHAQSAAAEHRRRYGGLHEVRTSRRTATPRPGFFE